MELENVFGKKMSGEKYFQPVCLQHSLWMDITNCWFQWMQLA